MLTRFLPHGGPTSGLRGSDENLEQFVAVAAHDFNNLLTIIKGYTNLLLSRQTLDDRSRDEISQIRTAGIHAETLVRQLLAFYRPPRRNPVRFDLDDLVRGVVDIISGTLDKRIQILYLPESGPWIFADRMQVHQVIMNLILNAVDAMPNGGPLTIRTGVKNLENGSSVRRAYCAISDTGTGIDPEIQDRIFEPFFTTKIHGTGLGLASAYAIVKQADGSIEVTSSPGQGSTFVVCFPLATDMQFGCTAQ